jgi:hypothetical protein
VDAVAVGIDGGSGSNSAGQSFMAPASSIPRWHARLEKHNDIPEIPGYKRLIPDGKLSPCASSAPCC